MPDPTTEERDALAAILPCSQCGGMIADRACGPTHALLSEYPGRHRLVHPFLTQPDPETIDAAVRATLTEIALHVESAVADVQGADLGTVLTATANAYAEVCDRLTREVSG